MESHIQAMADHWFKFVVCFLVVLNSQVYGSDFVNITLINSDVTKGAVCLDGSPPAYYYAEGFGEGANNWLVYIEGGGWCTGESDCLQRAQTPIGSSSKMRKRIYFGGLLSGNQTINSDFYNWNRVYVAYCDGASFMGDVEAINPKTNLTLAGAKVFNVVMEDLLAKGMNNASNAILAGGSAGGLATMLHCDGFRAVVRNAGRVKCISDSSLFIDAKDLPGVEKREQTFADVVAFHGIAKSLPTSCTSKMNPSLCFFPENLIGSIQTPLFLIDSTFDSWKIQNTLEPTPADQPSSWIDCTNQTKPCTPTQLQRMKDFKSAVIETLKKIGNSSTRGMFIHSCYTHGLMHTNTLWSRTPKLKGKTMAQAVGDWYFDRSSFQEIDTENDQPQRNCFVPS